MAISRRYQPSLSPGDVASIGLDVSDLLPTGVAIIDASLTIVTNTNPVQPQTDIDQQDPLLLGRQVWCVIQGGNPGTDYQCRWTFSDSQGHTWRRTALLLCGETS